MLIRNKYYTAMMYIQNLTHFSTFSEFFKQVSSREWRTGCPKIMDKWIRTSKHKQDMLLNSYSIKYSLQNVLRSYNLSWKHMHYNKQIPESVINKRNMENCGKGNRSQKQ
jgi:hypothetical protein